MLKDVYGIIKENPSIVYIGIPVIIFVIMITFQGGAELTTSGNATVDNSKSIKISNDSLDNGSKKIGDVKVEVDLSL